MSIFRMSSLKGAIHGIEQDGSFVHGAYSGTRHVGRTEEFSEPEVAGGGLAAVNPGAGPQHWRDLERRGFPKDTSGLHHLFDRHLPPAIQQLKTGPVVVMVHGFLFDPRDSVSTDPKDSDNPHSRLYHFERTDEMEEIRHHTSSWPRGLGFTTNDATGKEGLIVAFGWHSRPGFAVSLLTQFQNFYARAYANAEPAAWNLLTALHLLNLFLPAGKKVDFLCHSLGSRVVIRMIALAAKHGRLDLLDQIDRVLLLGGAEYVVEARHMLQRLHAVGMEQAICFYNIVSRENDVLDKLGENFGPITFGNSNVIGHNGLDVEDPKSLGPCWLDLQIDGLELQEWLQKKHKISVTGDNPESVWDHWYYYTDRGNMELYNAVLRDRANWDIPKLRKANIPDKVSRRRSIFGD